MNIEEELKKEYAKIEELIQYFDREKDFHARATLRIAKTNILIGLQKYEKVEPKKKIPVGTPPKKPTPAPLRTLY